MEEESRREGEKAAGKSVRATNARSKAVVETHSRKSGGTSAEGNTHFDNMCGVYILYAGTDIVLYHCILVQIECFI